MYQRGQLLDVTILDAAEGQQCFGRLPEGLAVMVNGTVAVGDRVEVEVFKKRKNYLETGLRRILEPSPHRVQPACAHFGVCGGCKWQHVDYAEQLRLKRKLVADALERIGGFRGVEVDEALPAPDVLGYRNKIEFSFGDRRFLLRDEMRLEQHALEKPFDFALGFHAAGVYSKVIDIDRCHLATPEMNETLRAVKELALRRRLTAYSTQTHEGFLRHLVLRQTVHTGQFMVYLITTSADRAFQDELKEVLLAALGDRLTTLVNGVTLRRSAVAHAEQLEVLHGPGHLVERLGPFDFAISPNSFFQTNTRQAERLYDTVMDLAALQPTETVYDLYCGTGTITLYAARRAREALGFELDAGSVLDARGNAERHGVGNARFFEIDMKHLAGVLPRGGERTWPDVVITDPPRAGMHEDAVELLRQLAPARIVYVSCNPASLARDAAALCQGGRYRLAAVRPVDLFPQTYHIESVARLERVDPIPAT